MTLLRVYDLIESRLFDKIKTLHALLANGIMDFLVAQKDKSSVGDGKNQRNNELLKIFKHSALSPVQMQESDSKDGAQADGSDYTG